MLQFEFPVYYLVNEQSVVLDSNRYGQYRRHYSYDLCAYL